jgi:lysophospholipase L1-like esterase
MGYTPRLAEALGPAARVDRIPANGGNSANVLRHLDAWVTGRRPAPALLVMNCGLHDLKVDRASGTHQTPLAEYEQNLRDIVERLRAAPALRRTRLVWARTTPVLDERHRASKPFDRRGRDVEAYNAAADRVMAAGGVATVDLWTAATEAGAADALAADGVHFTEDGYRRLAAVLAAALRPLLAGGVRCGRIRA